MLTISAIAAITVAKIAVISARLAVRDAILRLASLVRRYVKRFPIMPLTDTAKRRSVAST
jgi:hypothetical protein